MATKRDDYLRSLREFEEGCFVEFKKADGTTRKMRCTLNQRLIPAEDKPRGTGNRKVNLDIISVWDLEKQGWRSFRVDSVLAFHVINPS